MINSSYYQLMHDLLSFCQWPALNISKLRSHLHCWGSIC